MMNSAFSEIHTLTVPYYTIYRNSEVDYTCESAARITVYVSPLECLQQILAQS